MEDSLGGKGTLQGMECILAQFVPAPWMGLLGEVKEGSDSVGVVGNKSLVEIGESQE